MALISIVVPIYKVEKYLNRCIDSILNQTINNFELILVNDGSTDGCGKICDEYSRKDNRIKVIHKENGGLSDARNTGIKAAKGKYIGFIDSDDYIEADMYEILYNDIQSNNADISVCGYYTDYLNANIRNYINNEKFILNKEEALGMIDKISPGAWNKLYKREIFEDIEYPVGKLNEDVFIIINILEKCNKIVFDTRPKYHYIQRASSITKATFDERKWHCVDAWKKNLEIIKEKYPNQQEVFEYKHIGSYLHLLDTLILMPNYKQSKDYKQVDSFIRNNISSILKNKYIITKRKIALLAYIINNDIYKQIVLKLQKNRGLIN